MSKLNLERDRLDSSLGLKEGMSSIENSLSRTEKIISDIDKRISAISTGSIEKTYYGKKAFSGNTNLTTTNTKYLEFTKLTKNKYYKVTYSLYLYCDPYVSYVMDDMEFWISLISEDANDGNGNTEKYVKEAINFYGGNPEDNVGTEQEFWLTTGGSFIYKNLHTNGKMGLWIDVGSTASAKHKVYSNYDSSYIMIEELPYHEYTTKWD